MNKNDWKNVTEVRIEITVRHDGDYSWSFPIKCPRRRFNILSKLEI